jgi:hypothetical protein
MQPCSNPTCTRWVTFGEYCSKHEPASTLAARVKPANRGRGFIHANREHRAGLPAIDATDIRVTLRPIVGRVKPWSTLRGGTKALSDCIVTKADGSTYTIPANRRKRETHDVKQQTSKVDHTPNKLMQLATTKDHHDYTQQ